MADGLKILFITYTHSGGGGAEAVLTTLVNHLPKDWHVDILETVDLALKKEPIKESITLLSSLTKPSSEIIERMVRYVFMFHPHVIKALRGLYGYDVVISWMYRDASFMLPAFPECKKIAWFHGMVDDLLPSSASDIKNYLYKKKIFNLQKKACKCADRIVEISNKTKDSVLRTLPEFSDKVEVVYNGVDIERITQSSEQEIEDFTAKKICQDTVLANKPILVSIGRLEYNKNLSLALKALFILKQRDMFAYYLVVGKGDECELLKLKKLVEDLYLEDRVFFLGFQQNPISILRNCKILLVTSFEEGFSMVTAEAMTLGIPFVTTPVAGAGEELSNNSSCGLVSDWNAEEYADKVEILLKNDLLYKKMSALCKEHIKNFSVDSSLNSFYNILDAIAKKNVEQRKIRKIWASILFIVYASFGCIRKNIEVLNFRFYFFKQHTNFLNFCKLLYRAGRLFLSFLLFPVIVACSGFFALKNKKKLLGYV